MWGVEQLLLGPKAQEAFGPRERIGPSLCFERKAQ